MECGKIKSTTQNKGLVKKDVDKELIRLHRKRKELRDIERNMPLLPLKNPYQQGWVRTFEMSYETANSNQCDFYQSLLSKINTIQYSRVKSFSEKRRKNRKKTWEVRPQSLLDFDVWDWQRKEKTFSEKEKLNFNSMEYWCTTTRKLREKFVFSEPWRFVLKIRPNIITHQKMIDELLEQEIGEIDQQIDYQFLQLKINRLVYGRNYRWQGRTDEKAKHKHNYVNEWLLE